MIASLVAIILLTTPAAQDVPQLWSQRGDRLTIHACRVTTSSKNASVGPIARLRVSGVVESVGQPTSRQQYRWLSRHGDEYRAFESAGSTTTLLGATRLSSHPLAVLWTASRRYLWWVDEDSTLNRTSWKTGATRTWRLGPGTWEDVDVAVQVIANKCELTMRSTNGRDVSRVDLVLVDLSDENSPRVEWRDWASDFSLLDIVARGRSTYVLTAMGDLVTVYSRKKLSKTPAKYVGQGFSFARIGIPYCLAINEEKLFIGMRDPQFVHWKPAITSYNAKWNKVLRDGNVSIAIGESDVKSTVVALAYPTGLRFTTLDESTLNLNLVSRALH